MFRRLLIGTTLTFVLAACGGSGGDDPEAEPTEPAASGSTQTPEPSQADEYTACLASGPWHLDTGDYASQALAFMQGLGIPIVTLEISGDQTIQFTNDGLMALATDLNLHGVIQTDVTVDVVVSRTDEASSDWAFTDTEADRLKFTNFEWLSEESSARGTDSRGNTIPIDGEQFPSLDFSAAGAFIVACTEAGMSLQARGAPLVAYFTH